MGDLHALSLERGLTLGAVGKLLAPWNASAYDWRELVAAKVLSRRLGNDSGDL